MIGTSNVRRRASGVDRSRDRLVVVVAIGIALGFFLVALGAALLPESLRRGSWLPLHLALAGAATTAIAGVMPFFTAAFAAAPPSDLRLRLTAVLTVALGAASVSIGVVAGWAAVAAAGGVAFVLGITLVAIAALRPLGGALGPSRGIVIQGYVIALVEVGVGATLATLFVAGWAPLVGVWGSLKPAHAWLNLVGFASLVVATTLLHFFPTVVGARIAATRSARATVVALAAGPAVVALGFAFQIDLLGRAGALVAISGVVALAAYAFGRWRARGRWTTDREWHLFATGGLVSALAWFGVGMAIAAGRVVVLGAAPAAWSINTVFAPLVVGWIGLAVLASATHLLPAVGPGNPAVHARQRAILGRASVARLTIANVGIALLSIGLPLASALLVAAGTALAGLSLLSTVLLLGLALGMGMGRAG